MTMAVINSSSNVLYRRFQLRATSEQLVTGIGGFGFMQKHTERSGRGTGSGRGVYVEANTMVLTVGCGQT